MNEGSDQTGQWASNPGGGGQGGPPGGSYGGGPAGGDQPKKKKTALIIAAVVIVLALIGGGLVVSGALSSDSDTAGEVFLTAADDLGADPFSSTPFAPPPDPAPTPLSGTAGTVTAPSGTQLASTNGATPGLYGGTMNQAACDPDQMVAFLAENPSKAAAWVEAMNEDPAVALPDGQPLTVASIPQYVASLTPVVLQADTRVTNHGYKDGRPTRLQSVLQRGAAVMVDKTGVPRVKCYCGNPLQGPVATKTTPIYTGKAWADFNPTTINVVQKSTTVVNVFVLSDVKTGQLFDRPAGTTGAQDTPNTGTPPDTTAPDTTAPDTVPPSTTPPETTPPSTTPPETTPAPTTAPPTTAPARPDHCSPPGGDGSTAIDITNTRGELIEVFWVDSNCQETSFGFLNKGESMPMNTTVGHMFVAKTQYGVVVGRWGVPAGGGGWSIT